MRVPTIPALIVVLGAIAAAGPFLPQWVMDVFTVALAKALVVLGLVVMMRSGLVSFGQGLYFGLGAYTAGLTTNWWGITDAFVLVILGGLVSGAIGAVLGTVMVRYREIFFAMLSLALSMILYGVLVRSAALGSTDGFNLPPATFLGWTPGGAQGRLFLYVLAAGLVLAAAILLHLFVSSPTGVLSQAISTNEIRVEYLGASVTRILYINYIVASVTAGLGGALVALATGHIDPDLAYWTQSGEFVFVAILSGSGHVAAPIAGMVLFEWIRTFAFQVAPDMWQMIVGISMLAVILFLPGGLWSLFTRRRQAGIVT